MFLSVAVIILLDIAAITCLAFFISAASMAIRAIQPNTTRHTGIASPIFFDSIADMAHETFKQQMKTLTPDELLDFLVLV